MLNNILKYKCYEIFLLGDEKRGLILVLRNELNFKRLKGTRKDIPGKGKDARKAAHSKNSLVIGLMKGAEISAGRALEPRFRTYWVS